MRTRASIGLSLLCVLVVSLTFAAGCSALPGSAGNQLVLYGSVQSLTGEPAQDRLVVVFLDAKEAARTITRCESDNCLFTLALPNTYQYSPAGAAPGGAVRLDLGLIPEGEHRTLQVQSPIDPAHRLHVYTVQVLAGLRSELPQELRSERLGMMPDGGVVAIGEPPPNAAAPSGGGFGPVALAVALALLCCSGLLALVVVVVLVLVWTRRPRTGQPVKPDEAVTE